ncbi:oxidoreductase [Mycolicibacterium chubuense]|uniref:Putative FAD-linked oxidoreductase n=1 Tax=Mycolicibacterium chubuense TaxID=1800 RepID=A0A0J6WEL9_MYCCU|nr:FAD-binding oxidoreductase [Mycolicibacterium chubuense]KMO80212.1 putative FAD-linked oxidoreductase [Mycolicibacterium chubuense]ORA54731.1 oxidoreductase [Mycolicibacterium chubuense]SPY45576.1 FAD linked oxidase domain-containing protein [Mycolicibacterium chubuense]
MTEALTGRLAAIVGASQVSTDPDVLGGRSVDYTGRYRGRAAVLVRPGSAEEVAAVLTACRDAGVSVTVQGGRTSLVAGTVPEHDDVLLSTERLRGIDEVDTVERRVHVGAGVTLAEVQRAATAAGLVFGVDLAARDSATVGGMASTNAGGLRTVCYGNMGEQVLGLDVVLPDGSVVHRHSQVRSDNTGYDLASLFVGAEGTLGVITGLDLRLHPTPRQRVTAICGYADLEALIATARVFRDMDGIAALELIDARASALTAEHAGVAAPVEGAWQLLIELAGETDLTDRLAEALSEADLCGEPAVGIDGAAQQRLWQVREAVADVLGVYGPPLKFDVSLPLSSINGFAAESAGLIADHAPDAIPVLFGHVGEGNLHLNIVRCTLSGDREHALYTAMMALIARHDGNVSSEHGVGTRKRDYVSMSRTDADIAAMRAVKAAFDPTGYLNPAVLFG